MFRISTFGILGKPAFQDAFFLFENFLYRPERRKSKDTANSRDENAFNQQGSDRSCYSQNEKDPPAFRAPIIFSFHYNRMKKTDNQKSYNAYQQSVKVNQVHTYIYELKPANLPVETKIQEICIAHDKLFLSTHR